MKSTTLEVTTSPLDEVNKRKTKGVFVVLLLLVVLTKKGGRI